MTKPPNIPDIELEILVGQERIPIAETQVFLQYPDTADAMIFEARQFSRLEEIDSIFANILRMKTGNSKDEEEKTWQAKELAAIAHQNNTANVRQTRMLSISAAKRDVTVDTLAVLILAKADAYYDLIGAVDGDRDIARAAVKSCVDVAGLEDAMTTMRRSITIYGQ